MSMNEETKSKVIIVVEGGIESLSPSEVLMLKNKLGENIIILDANDDEAKQAMKDANIKLNEAESIPFKIEPLPDLSDLIITAPKTSGKPSKEQRRNWNKQNYKKK